MIVVCRLLGRMARIAAGCGALMGCAAAVAPAARADTLVYVKNGTVFVSRPDGSGARAVTSGSNGWAWPSETDSGVIAVAGGLSRVVNGTFNPSGSDQIYEFDQQGRQLSGPVNTQGSYSTVSDPEYVSHFRVAPDNSNVAYSVFPSYTDSYASWEKPTGSPSFSYVKDSYGAPLPYASPEWWGPGHLLITHDGVTLGSEAEYAIYSLADGSSPGWNNDQAIGNWSSYQVAISRSGLVFAVMTDDAPDYGGTVHNIAITLETTATPPVTSNVTDTHCTITLPASKFAGITGSSLASMSFSSDGSTLAWGQDDGIYEANVSNPNNCAQVTGSVHMVVPGGQMPFLGAAPLSPPKPPPPPPAPPRHHSKPVAAFSLVPAHPHARHKVRFNGSRSHESGGRIARYRWSFGDGKRASGARPSHVFRRAGRYTVTLTVTDAAGRTATIKRRIRVGR
jgi:PKD domain